jgi:acetyl esterase/lipase
MAALVFPRPAHEAPLPPIRPAAGRTRVLAGVRYAALPGFRPLELDLWLPPESADPVPAVLFLHGGGWRMGSRHLAGPAFEGAEPTPFELMAQAGLAVASADYRLCGEARWPAQLHDAKAAVPDAAAQASPVTHVSPGVPPFLLLHGSADRLVPCAQSERLHRALRQAGASTELTLYEGADHICGPGRPGPRHERCSRRSMLSAGG